MSGSLLEDRITVLILGEGRHLFESVHDPRLCVVRRRDEAPRPDLIVCPCGHDRRFESIRTTRLLDKLRGLVSSGTPGIVFDASTEGVLHKPDASGSLHELLEAVAASPRQCVYVTQDRGYEADYRTHCAAIGVEQPVAVVYHDYWIWYALTVFEGDGEQVYQERLAAFQRRKPSRDRRFLSLNRTPRPTKILFLLRLLRDGLFDRGFVSFGGFSRPGEPGKPKPSIQELGSALPGFEEHVVALAPYLDELERRGRVLLGMERHGWERLSLWNASLASELAEYHQSWFTAATDTEMRPRVSRITEKVLKPLLNFHPMLVLGNPGALQMLRSYGFETFGDVFDESYDDELDPRRRFDLVYGQVERMCRLAESEIHRMENAIAEKLMFNAHWGLTRFAAACRAERDGVLVDTILDAVNHTARSTRMQ